MPSSPSGPLGDDLALLGRIVWTPRQAFLSLDDDRVRWVGFAVPALATVARLFYGGRAEEVGAVGAVLLVAVSVAVVLPLWALAVRVSMRLFGREISFVRVLNVGNYTQVPRLGAALALLAADPVGRWFGPDSQGALGVAVLAALGFSVGLYVWGLAVLSEPRTGQDARASGGEPPAPSPEVPAGGSSVAKSR